MKNVGNLKLVAYGLFLFYGITFLTYLLLLEHPSLGVYAGLLALIFIVLCVASIGLLRWQEWGRQLVIITNGVLFALGIFLCQEFPQFFPLAYMIIVGVTIAFYSQGRVKGLFQPIAKLRRKSVLIVDDDEGIIRTVQKALLPNGYSVLTAMTGEKGLQVAQRQLPDLVILDVLLPGMKGREVCAALKAAPETKGIPVLFVTAKDSPDDIKAEMDVGGTAHLSKPVNGKTLLAEVRRIIG